MAKEKPVSCLRRHFQWPAGPPRHSVDLADGGDDHKAGSRTRAHFNQRAAYVQTTDADEIKQRKLAQLAFHKAAPAQRSRARISIPRTKKPTTTPLLPKLP